jgi:hypothetical protein
VLDRHLASLGRDGLDLADDLEFARRRAAAARRHRGEQDEHEWREPGAVHQVTLANFTAATGDCGAGCGVV